MNSTTLGDARRVALAPRVPQAHPWPRLGQRLAQPGALTAGREALVFLALLLLALVLRAGAFLPSVINPDESLYAVQAQAWLRGAWPYEAVWDMHPPGAPALFALAFGLFGESLASLRLLGVLAVAATAHALAGLARQGGAGRLAGLGAGALYVALAGQLDGLATNTEILLAPLLAWAMRLGLAGQLGPAGLLVGLALLIKPVVLPQGCLVFLLAGWPVWRRLPGRALLYALCCAAPLLALGAVYAARGSLDALLEGIFLAPLRYIAMGIPPGQALRQSLAALATLPLPLLLAAAVLAPLPGRAAPVGLARLGLAWLAAAALAVALPGMYFAHYFQLLLPPLALLAALGARRLARLARPRLVAPAFALLLAAPLLASWAAVLQPRLEHGIGLRQPDPPQRVAALLRDGLRPGEAIFVLNWQPLLYFLTGTAPPSRFVHPAQLAGRFAGVTGADPDAELARVLATRPRFIVLDGAGWPGVRPAARAAVEQALAEGYALLAEIPAEAGGKVEVWQAR